MKAVIFDLDGVVVNTAKYHYLAWKKLASELGFEFPGLSGMDKMAGIMQNLRENPLTEVAGVKVAQAIDYTCLLYTSEADLPLTLC